MNILEALKIAAPFVPHEVTCPLGKWLDNKKNGPKPLCGCRVLYIRMAIAEQEHADKLTVND